MKILRIIDKDTKLFIRDDFNFDPEIEIALDVEPAQGFIWPKWSESNNTWIESSQ